MADADKKISAEEYNYFRQKSRRKHRGAYWRAKIKVRSLVIESYFTSYVDMGRKLYPYLPVRWFARFKYDTIGHLRKVRCPVMIIHSRNDEIVPFEFGLELYDAANEPKEFVEIYGSHNDGFLVSDEIYKGAWKKWIKFLSEQQAAGRSAASRTLTEFSHQSNHDGFDAAVVGINGFVIIIGRLQAERDFAPYKIF